MAKSALRLDLEGFLVHFHRIGYSTHIMLLRARRQPILLILITTCLLSVPLLLITKHAFKSQESISVTRQRTQKTEVSAERCCQELAYVSLLTNHLQDMVGSSTMPCPESSAEAGDKYPGGRSSDRSTISSSPRSSSEAISALWEDPELQSVVAAFRTVVPQEFLKGYKNPCWFVDYRILESIVRANELYEGQRFDRGAQASEEIVQAVMRGLYGTVTPGRVKSNELVCLPYFVMLGFIKCGTTTLHNLVEIHPDFAKPRDKEIFWWTKLHWAKQFPGNVVDVMQYVFHFLNASKSIAKNPSRMITGDSSPTYIHEAPFFKDFYDNVSRKDIERIPQLFSVLLPKAKFLVIFREPADRLRSDFYYFAHNNCPSLLSVANEDTLHNAMLNRVDAFKECMAVVKDDLRCMYLYRKWIRKDYACFYYELRFDATIYYLSVELWLRYFPREQFLFVRNEDLHNAEGKLQVAKKIHKFLGLHPMDEDVLLSKLTEQKELNHGPTNLKTTMRNDTKVLLREFFAPYNKKLADLLDDERYLWKDAP